MTGEDLYVKALALGALPMDSTEWWSLPFLTRDAWDELASQAASTCTCDDCGYSWDENEDESGTDTKRTA